MHTYREEGILEFKYAVMVEGTSQRASGAEDIVSIYNIHTTGCRCIQLHTDMKPSLYSDMTQHPITRHLMHSSLDKCAFTVVMYGHKQQSSLPNKSYTQS